MEYIWLPGHCSAQWEELYALTRALTLPDGKRANIYTDSCYAFPPYLSMGPFTKRGLLTSEVKRSKTVNKSYDC
jgi:hypothetical protein